VEAAAPIAPASAWLAGEAPRKLQVTKIGCPVTSIPPQEEPESSAVWSVTRGMGRSATGRAKAGAAAAPRAAIPVQGDPAAAKGCPMLA
jgi:hypothetical protein